ncbi:MAG: formylglycine-generating enzyme family protein [Flammeovirgaceae bacterium]
MLKGFFILNIRYFVAFCFLIQGCYSGSVAEPTGGLPTGNAGVRLGLQLPEMVLIPGGEKLGFRSASKFEITWSQYRSAVELGGCRAPVGFRVEGSLGGGWLSERTSLADPRFSSDLPVTGISKGDIDCFLAWLNGQTGRSFRLPRAQQWRWLAYGSADTLFPWGDTARFGVANISANGVRLFDQEVVGKPEAFTAVIHVGRFPPNEFGLHDTIGNAGELVDEPCSEGRLGLSQEIYPSCLVMGGYHAPVVDAPRTGKKYLMVSDGTAGSVGFRIIE